MITYTVKANSEAGDSNLVHVYNNSQILILDLRLVINMWEQLWYFFSLKPTNYVNIWI